MFRFTTTVFDKPSGAIQKILSHVACLSSLLPKYDNPYTKVDPRTLVTIIIMAGVSNESLTSRLDS